MSSARLQTSVTEQVVLILCAALLFSVLSLSYLKALNGGMQVWGEFYWYVDYSQGFIRRGLIGQILSPIRKLFGAADTRLFNSLVVGLYHGFCYTVLTALVLWGARLVSRLDIVSASWLLGGLLLFVVSPVVPTQAYNTGYIDIVMLAAGLVGAVLAWFRWYLVAFLAGFAVTLMNEAVLFMWLPVAVLILARHSWRQADLAASATAVLAIVAPLLGIATIVAFEVPGAAARLINQLHFDPNMRDVLIKFQYGQSAVGQLNTQISYLRQLPLAFMITAIYTQVPTLLLTLIAIQIDSRTSADCRLFVRTRVVRWLLFFAFAFSPFSLLIFSWDLSRMMTWTNWSAVVLLLLAATCLAGERTAR